MLYRLFWPGSSMSVFNTNIQSWLSSCFSFCRIFPFLTISAFYQSQTKMNITVRFAQASDIEALTQIGIAAFPFEPQWPYRYPHRKQYPEEHYKHTKIRYTEWLAAATAKQCMIMVAEAPSIEDLAVRKVVALSIWRLPPQFEDRDDNHKCA